MFVSECLTAVTGNCVSWRWSFCRTATFVYTWLQCWLSRKKRKEEWGADCDAAWPLENHSRWGKYKIIRTIYVNQFLWQVTSDRYLRLGAIMYYLRVLSAPRSTSIWRFVSLRQKPTPRARAGTRRKLTISVEERPRTRFVVVRVNSRFPDSRGNTR